MAGNLEFSEFKQSNFVRHIQFGKFRLSPSRYNGN